MSVKAGSAVWVYNNILEGETKNSGTSTVEVLEVADLYIEVKHYKTEQVFRLLLEDLNETWFLTNPEKWKSDVR